MSRKLFIFIHLGQENGISIKPYEKEHIPKLKGKLCTLLS